MRKEYEEKYFSGEESFYYRIGGGYKEYINYWKKFEELILRFKDKGSLLDIGCAYGFLLKHMKSRFKCYGSDISKYAIDKAKAHIKKVNFKVNDVCESFPFKQKFDVITIIDVIEHLKCHHRILKEIYKHLKKDGIVIIKTPHLSWFRKTFFKNWDIEEGHIYMYDVDDLITELKKVGFKIIGYNLAFTDFKHYVSKEPIRLKKYVGKINSNATELIVVVRK